MTDPHPSPVQVGLIAADVAAGVLAVVSLTMTVLPLIALFARRAGHYFAKEVSADPVFTVLPPDAKPPLDLNKATMDRYRPEMRKFYLGEQPRLF